MAINAVNTDNFIPVDTYLAQQAVEPEAADFSEVLSKTIPSGSVDLDAIFDDAARIYGLPVNLLKAVAKAESGFRVDAKSGAGAMGIMQLMPATARGLGVTDPYDPEQNIMGGAKYLREMMDQFGDVKLALAAYNAGPGNVTKYNGIPPFTETQNYVKTVTGYMGGEIVAGQAVTRLTATAAEASTTGMTDFGSSIAQMLLMKVIEMQMDSSDDDENKVQ